MAAMPMAAAATGPDLTLIAVQKEKMGVLLTIRQKAAQFRDWTLSLAKGAWEWARRSFLDTTWDYISRAATWLKAKVSWLMELAGPLGGLGLGLLAMTTSVGRSIVSNTIGRVLGWFRSAASWVYHKVLDGIDHLGKPGRWVVDRLDDVEAWIERRVTGVKKWCSENLAQHWALDSNAMKLGRVGGVLMVAARILTFFTSAPLQYLFGAAVGAWALLNVPMPEKANEWIDDTFDTHRAKKNQPTKPVAVPDLKTKSVVEEVADVIAHSEFDIKLNRQERRAVRATEKAASQKVHKAKLATAKPATS